MSDGFQAGQEIPSLSKTAFMPIEENARNPIHTEEYARRQGLRGALIPGSTLLSYLLEMLYNLFGEKWLTAGKIKVSFIGGGAVNGDRLTAGGRVRSVEPTTDGERVFLDLWMENQYGTKIVVGEAECLG